MKRLAKWMMRLYPARWRRRYGDELDALLTETGADARVVTDLFRGGVRMQFSTWSLAKLAVVLGIAGLLLGVAGSFLITPVYVSQAALEASAGDTTTVLTPYQRDRLMLPMKTMVLSRASLANIINRPGLDLYRDQRITTPLEDVIEEMRNDIQIRYVGATAFSIAFRYPDAVKARQTVGALLNSFKSEAQYRRQIQRAQPDYATRYFLDVIDTPSLPVHPFFPDERMVMLAGCVLGILLACVWRALQKRASPMWGFALLAAILAITGTIAGFIASDWDRPPFEISNLLRNRYRSTATLLLNNGTPTEIDAIANEATSRSSLAMVIEDPRLRLYQVQLRAEPIESVIQTMRQHLTIAPEAGRDVFTVSFEYPDRYKAQQTVQWMTNRLDAVTRRLYGDRTDGHGSTPLLGSLTVLDAPSTPVMPVSPNRYQMAAEGCFGGLLSAAIIATVRRRWKPEGDIPIDAVNG